MPGARPYSQRRMLPRNMSPFRPKHSPVLRCAQQNATVSCLWVIAGAQRQEKATSKVQELYAIPGYVDHVQRILCISTRKGHP